MSVALCLSVCPSQVGVFAKHSTMQATPHNSLETVVFWCQTSRQNSNRVTLKYRCRRL